MEQTPITEIAVRDRLLEAAISLFARKGYHATSVREIVEAAGVTKPVLYYWFRSKEGVFRQLMDDAVAVHRGVLEEVRATGGTVSDRVQLLCERVMALAAENVDFVRTLDSVYYGPREGAPAVDFDELYGEFDRNLRALVEEGAESGEFRGDVEAMHHALLGAFLICKATVAMEDHQAHGCHAAPGALDVRGVVSVVLKGMCVGGREVEEEQR